MCVIKATLLACLYCLSICVNASRILAALSTPPVSHHISYRPYIQALVNAGHDLTVITAHPDTYQCSNLSNFKAINVYNETVNTWNLNFDSKSWMTLSMYDLLRKAVEILANVFENQMKAPMVKQLVESREHFDLVIFDALIRPSTIFTHLYDAPGIQLNSVGEAINGFDFVGASTHNLYYPSSYRRRSYNLTTWEVVKEIYTQTATKWMYYSSEEKENQMLQNILNPDIPRLGDISSNVHMSFSISNSLWDSCRPVPLNAVYFGGPKEHLQKELPQDLKSFLDSSKHGVIYMSFGTTVRPSQLPPSSIQYIKNAFAQLQYDVLWKWESDKMTDCPKNVKVSKWVPQTDVLRHPKVKLFITQCGLHSSNEAIAAGVPLIGIPIIADQYFNAEKYVHHKIGIKIDFDLLTEESFKNAINAVIEDDSYRRNIIKLRTLLNDQPQSAQQRAVWWTEYVLRHGGARHLRSPAANMALVEYLELELVAIIATLAVIMSCLVICLKCKIIRLFLCKLERK